MLFRVNWSMEGRNRNEVIQRFLSAADDPNYALPDGLTMKGRWHNSAGLDGTAIMETDDINLLYSWILNWNDVCDTEVDPVVEDEAAGQLCVELMNKINSQDAQLQYGVGDSPPTQSRGAICYESVKNSV